MLLNILIVPSFFLMPSSIPRYGYIIILGCFHFWVIINKASMDIHVKVFLWTHFLFVSHRPMAGLEWPPHIVGVREFHILRNG